MDEQATRAHESARQSQEGASPRHQQRARDTVKDTARAAGQVAGLGSETFTVWSDVAQRALRDVGELSAQATQEYARQITEWQQANLDMMRDLQAIAVRCSTLWPEVVRDPIGGYQRSLEEAIDATQRVFELTRGTAETLTQSCQRLERAADQTTHALGETFREASTRMQEVYARSERLRAA
jgi:hypothetical protein